MDQARVRSRSALNRAQLLGVEYACKPDLDPNIRAFLVREHALSPMQRRVSVPQSRSAHHSVAHGGKRGADHAQRTRRAQPLAKVNGHEARSARGPGRSHLGTRPAVGLRLA
jgi:hypothetical protein